MPIPPEQSTMPIAPMLPALPSTPGGLPGLESLEGEPETAPLPLPTPEALRTMFAELGGDTAARAIVESGNAPPAPAAPNRELEISSVADDGASDVGAALWPEAPDISDTSDGVSNMRDKADIADEEPAPQTIEDLERQFAASGFTHIETHRGLLAEIDRDQHDPQTGNGMAQEEPPAVSEPVVSEPVASEPVAKGPNPRDYPARLAHARQRRSDGQLDEALNEYRAIIKNAPDLLPEVLSDLRASLAETPDHPNLHSVLGDALVCQGEYEEAMEAFNRATELAQARNRQS